MKYFIGGGVYMRSVLLCKGEKCIELKVHEGCRK